MRSTYSLLFLLSLLSCGTSAEGEIPLQLDDRVSAIDAALQSIPSTKLAEAANSLTLDHVEYDPFYFTIPYPNGDVPAHVGVCTDVVIRAYRKLAIDLQKEVHEDMTSAFEEYPDKWGLSSPDKNIDHRRVPNLRKFYERQNAALEVTKNEADYLPGDVVSWNLGKGITHIGIVSDRRSKQDRPMIIHNVGSGQVAEDVLFAYEITGHYRWRVNG